MKWCVDVQCCDNNVGESRILMLVIPGICKEGNDQTGLVR